MATYNSLVAELTLYTENNDIDAASAIPSIITYAEREIADRLKGEHTVVVFEGMLLDPGENWINKPSNLVRPLQMWAITSGGTYLPLVKRTYSYCVDFDPTTTVSGNPKYYAEYDKDFFFITPSPGSSMSLEMRALIRIIGLSNSTQTTFISTTYPQLLFKACLKQFGIYDKNPEMYELYSKEVDAMIKSVETEVKITQLDLNRMDNASDLMYKV